MIKNIDYNLCGHIRIFFLITLLIFIIYSNTFRASFHFDDFPNITQNTKLHIENLYPETIYTAVFEDREKKFFYRPISNMSIAINWYFGKTDVTGYHIFNITIHILTAFLLYLSLINLFKAPNLNGLYKGDEFFIAVMAACLWAVNPIQTQAVTYIVQRMASMAALFYILGIYFYIKARTSNNFKQKALFFSGVAIAFVLGVGSKENAIMMPISLLLLEIVFFLDITDSKIRRKFFLAGCLLVIFVLAGGIFLFMNGAFIESILSGYESRTFTLSQRLLTEPRIIIFYLTQIFYPIADRLSLDHDIVVSTGMFSPWTTFPAIIFILFLVALALWQLKKRPLFSFAVLFFFLNHVVESSAIALELIFEHRNYLPSLFLFVPVAAGLKRVVNYYAKREEKMMGGVLICSITILIMMLGLGTYVRNMAWADEKTLWEDTMAKAPGRARGYQNLASGYYAKIGDFEKVKNLSEKAMHLSDNTKHKAKIISLSNIAIAYIKQSNDYQKAIQFYNQILIYQPEHNTARFRLAILLIKTDRLIEAMKHIELLLEENSESVTYLNLKAFVLLRQNKPDDALTYIIKAIENSLDAETTLLNAGLAKIMMGEYASAEHFLKRLNGRLGKNITALFLLIENSVKSGDIQKSEKYVESLIDNFSISQIQSALKQNNKTDLQWPVKTDLIVPMIAKKIKKQSVVLFEIVKSDNG